MTIPHNIGNNGEKWYAPFFKIEHSSASRWLKTPANGHLLRPWFTWLPVLSRAWRFCTTPHCGLETRFDVKGFACWLLFFFGDVRWVFISKIDTSDTSDTSHKRVFTDTSDTSHPLKKKKTSKNNNWPLVPPSHVPHPHCPPPLRTSSDRSLAQRPEGEVVSWLVACWAINFQGLLLMVQKSGVHQLRLVGFIPLFTGFC